MTRRILGSMLVVTAVALLLLGIPLAIALGRLYHSQELTRLQREATLAAGAVPSAGFSGPDPIEPPPTARRATRFGYYDFSGRLVDGAGPPRADPRTRAALQGRVEESSQRGLLIVAVPISVGEAIHGAVRAAEPLGALHARTYRTWAAVAVLGGAALAVAATIGHRQARRLARPVIELTDAMGRLGQGDFTVRASVGSGIPEIETAGRALDVTAENLGALLDRERAFSADVSHQLRTPLAGLRITLEAALVVEDGIPADTISSAMAEVDRLEATVEELLAHARNTSGPREIVDFDRIIGAAEGQWHAKLANLGRPFRVKVDQVPPVRASSNAVAQILDVLVDNAVTHGQGTVSVHLRAAGPGVAIDVSDEGAGIDPNSEAIFERGVSSRRSAGIGLALARSLAQSQGGQLLARRTRSNPIFSLILPAEKPSRQEQTASS